MQIKKDLISCSFTGHRPTRFVFKYDETHSACIELKKVLAHQIERLYKRGVRKFYTGCAMGVDMWAGEAVLSLKNQYSDIELFCAVPFRGQAEKWEQKQQRRYNKLLKSSDKVFILSEEYTTECYFNRNRFLVDNADVLLAVYDMDAKKRSGTGYTVNYAAKIGKPILLIHPDTLQIMTNKVKK